MKESIRRGVFETNSSSTHSLTLCSLDEFEKWKNGDLYISCYDKDFITKAEYEALDNECNCDKDYECECDKDYYSYEEFWDRAGEYFETFEQTRDDVVAFGYFGYDS